MKYQAVRGMHDVLPPNTQHWQHLESVLKQLAGCYGYQEIRLPLVESAELFQRAVGEATDIVEKEMYVFEDRPSTSRSGRRLALRPEGTVGCVRACLEHGWLGRETQRLWYLGPMFRHERPQKGRYRQFQQFSVEALGMEGPDIDAELILMGARLFRELGLTETVILHLNTLGDTEARRQYRDRLFQYFSHYEHALDTDSRRRLHTNPLRILDSKQPALQEIIARAPTFDPCLEPEARQHFERLQDLLQRAQVAFTLNPRLVRGLDYYNRTVFEWVMQDTTSGQNTVCAGGRYDGLATQLGGPTAPAAGFSVGLERLLQLWLLQAAAHPAKTPDVYVILVGESAKREGLALTETLRTALPNLTFLADCTDSGLKAQFRHADKSGARFALILGDEEVSSKTFTLKSLREAVPQQRLTLAKLIEHLRLRNSSTSLD